MTGTLQRLETVDEREQSGERNDVGGDAYRAGREVLRAVADALDFTDVAVQTAEAIYRNAIGKGVHEGRRVERIGVASVPLAARVHAKPVALGRVAEVTAERVPAAHVDERRQLSAVMNIVADATGTNVPPSTAEEYIASIVEGVEADAEGDDDASGFGNPGTVITEARAALAAASGSPSESGHSPPGVAAGAIFRVAEDRAESVTGEQIGDAAGVSRPTVYKHARRLLGTDGGEGA